MNTASVDAARVELMLAELRLPAIRLMWQKLAAQAVPVIGAVGGAAVNYAFIDHFQQTAQGHFAVRRLERAYGKELVRAEYERLRGTAKPH